MEAAAVGEVRPRTLPTIDRDAVLYHRFIMYPVMAREYPFEEVLKGWSGEPTVTIHKAARGMTQVVEPENVDVDGRMIQTS